MFQVSARTVLELGKELISSDPIAFYELIKNGFDAGTVDGVVIRFEIVLGKREYNQLKRQVQASVEERDEADEHDTVHGEEFTEELKEKIVSKLNVTDAKKPGRVDELLTEAHSILDHVEELDDVIPALDQIYQLNRLQVADTGSGMTMTQLTSVFLVIGTSSRRDEVDAAILSGSDDPPPLGEKGIGRLSAMRLGEELEVITATRSDSHYSCLSIDWAEFERPGKMIDEIVIEPYRGEKKSSTNYHGTTINIQNLNADWNERRVERLVADDISLLVNPLGPAESKLIEVYWNGKRLPIRKLDRDFLSHAHAKISGSFLHTKDGPELNVRYEIKNLGSEEIEEISIDRMNGADLAAALVGPSGKRKRTSKRDQDYDAINTVGPFKFEFFWFNRRTLRKGRAQADYQALLNLLNQWIGVRLYRDGFRVYPYGDEEDDWLELDSTALRSKGYALNRIQMVGQVEIGRISNPFLVDQTNREGLRNTPEEYVLVETLQLVVDRLRDEMNRLQKERQAQRPKLVRDDVAVRDLEKRMKGAIKKLKKVVPDDQIGLVEDLELMREQFARYSAEAWIRIGEMEKDAEQMLAMAGIGLMVEMVAHELTRSAENALDTLNSLKKKQVPDSVKTSLESLRASMKSISKRLRILDPLSVSGRQRKEKFYLDELVEEIVEAHAEQFRRHDVKLDLTLPDKPVEISAVKGMVVQVIENLISNSLYWMEIESGRKVSFNPILSIFVEANPPRIRLSDNGPGISKENSERVFDLFFSLKDKNRRRGLGLYIAREAAEHNGGELIIDEDFINKEGRYSMFDYRVVGE